MKSMEYDGTNYISADGHMIQRDPKTKVWILRNPIGLVIDKNPYRYDLAEMYGFKLEE